MAAPSVASIAKFLAAPPKQIGGFLFYGSDALQISARAEALVQVLIGKDATQGEILRFHEADLTADPERILIELATRPLFGGRKTVWLTSLPAKAHASLLDAISQPISDAYLIVQAPDLRKTHKLTQTFEEASFLATIACWGEDQSSLPTAIRQQLSSAGYSIDSDAIALIAARSNYSALIARSETDKLMSFIGTPATVTIEDVDACLGDQQTSSIQDAVDAAFEGDGRKALLAFERLIASDQNLPPVLSAISAGLQRLHSLRSAANAGIPLVQAIKNLRPPVFYKQQDAIARQARFWSSDVLLDFIRRSNETLRETRQRPQLAEDLTRNFLLDIARTSRQSQKAR